MPTEQTCSRCRAVVMQEFSRDSAPEHFKAYWGQTYYSVLCISCADHLMTLHERVKGCPVPAMGMPLQEGLHFEMEGLNLVFTEAYHMMRGHCCRSSCKNCVYGLGAHQAI